MKHEKDLEAALARITETKSEFVPTEKITALIKELEDCGRGKYAEKIVTRYREKKVEQDLP